VVGCETKREENGLALSSRNLRLSEEGKKLALLFYVSLKKAKGLINDTSLDEIRSSIESDFESEENCSLEYFEIADSTSLKKVENIKNHDSVIGLIAGYVEGIRLIDNLILIP
jgi:pantoate--beta-alanine ligase